MSLSPGDRLGEYEILSLLGTGGIGEVYCAKDLRLGRQVALKIVHNRISVEPSAVDRFIREARAASALNHPNIVTIHDIGETDAGRYIVMELVRGQTLRALVGKQLELESIIQIGLQTSRALAAAHEVGIIHRDIKPENIMVREDGYVKLLDFGLALPTAVNAAQSDVETAPATALGALVGTVPYMSPEQARGKTLTTATDIFSLGVVLYELVTGRHPMAAESQLGMLHAILTQSVVPPSRLNPDIPLSLEAPLLQMLLKDPRLRPSAAEIGRVLNQLAGAAACSVRARALEPKQLHIVGRTSELQVLRTGFDRAAGGIGQLVCVSGEPGIGKTTLVESFLNELATSEGSCYIARGSCSERLAGAEAYLPFLEALESLLQNEADSVRQVMRVIAPTWYAQIASLPAGNSSPESHVPDIKSTSQERLKRELLAFLTDLTKIRPLVLFFDDLHWADPSTVDLLNYLGSKLASLRMMGVATYRTTDLLLRKHPFAQVKLDLQARGICREIEVSFLTRQDVEDYLALRFPEHRFPSDFRDLIHSKTEGNPLFMVDLIRDLHSRGVIAQEQRQWVLAQALDTIERQIPESARSMIQRKIEQIDEADHRLLLVASVQGQEFDSAVIAQVLSADPAGIEERLDYLERVHALVRRVCEQELPAGILSLSYRFVHVLYQNALYGSLTPTRRSSLSGAVAETLVALYGNQTPQIASRLALLFEAARNYSKAVDYFWVAAQRATQVFANREAIALARRGLQLVDELPETPERLRKELQLQTTLGVQLIIVEGFSQQTEETYIRARELCRQLGDSSQLFQILDGLGYIYLARADLPNSQKMTDELFGLAETLADPFLRAEAHWMKAWAHFAAGDFRPARDILEKAISFYDVSQFRSGVTPCDPAVSCECALAWTLSFLGYPDQAWGHIERALTLARNLQHYEGIARALGYGTFVYQLQGHRRAVLEQSQAVIDLSTEHNFAVFPAIAHTYRGWALACRGSSEEGIAQIRDSLAMCRAIGIHFVRAFSLGLLAEALAGAGRIDEAISTVHEALAEVDLTGQRYYEAELHRLKGQLLLMKPTTSQFSEAESCFHRAMEIATRQEAKWFQLRTATSLSRLWERQGRKQEARQLLADVYSSFTEGFDTPYMKEAKSLLDQICHQLI